MAFLPVNRKDMEAAGWEQPDFVLVTGDAYVDHPSFGTAIISRYLEACGYKVAILAQPEYRNCEDFRGFGKPRLGFLINSGNVDSMVNHFSVSGNRRKNDRYSPGGKAGRRPDRAVIVYSNLARQAYKGVPVIIGGIEASLRRFGHYDYWSDSVRRSILLDSKADLLIYGMGERAVKEIADALDSGLQVSDITWIRGTCYRKTARELEAGDSGLAVEREDVVLPAFEEISSDRQAYAQSFRLQYRANDSVNGKRMLEEYPGGTLVIQNPPQPPLEREELDYVYELPYERKWHPMYDRAGGVPALSEVKFSITSNRGCFGGCSFCALTFHQGREVRSRSADSIVAEAERMTKDPDFKGYIHDIGGPTANFREPSCAKQKARGLCSTRDCLYPKPCRELKCDHQDYMEVLTRASQVPGVKKVFIRSGIRFDYVMADRKHGSEFLNQLCRNHVSGTLKVAPEHICPGVLSYMHKPEVSVYKAFAEAYRKENEGLGKKQYLIPYLISSHPGSTLRDAIELALYLKENGFAPDQVQDFYPTPGSLSTCMYYTGLDPLTGQELYVARDPHEKRMQRALLHCRKPENRKLVEEALRKAGKQELIPVLLGGKTRRR